MTFHYCMYLDPRGYPCNRRVTKPLGFCDRHREKPASTRRSGPTAAYQRERRKRLAQAGVMPGTEAM